MTKNKIALVTGGSRGIGAEICITLKKAKYKVVAIYCGSCEKAEAFTKKHKIPIYKCDVSHFEECQAVIAKIKKDMKGNIDVLVNNAGITRDSMMHKMLPDAWQKVIDVNLSSCYNMSRAVINDMREQKFGRIINISSINALAGQLGQTNYSASKAGIIGFTKALARESAIKNITVNAIAPGYIATDMTNAMPQEVLDKITATIPVGRIGDPKDIARTVAFLASDDAGFITGATINVNGGGYMY